MKRNKVAIIFGGKSAEHEVSLASATNVYQAMDKERFMPVLIGINKSGEWFYNGDYPSSTVNLTENDYFQKAQNVYLSSTGDNIKVINKKDNTVLADFNVAFPIVHGTFGEDGTLQGILKSAGIPFVGPDVLASAIAMDKDIAKRLFQLEGIPVASSYTVYKHNASSYTFKQITDRMGLPCFVKPANAGSSVGVSKVRSEAEYRNALQEAFRYDNKVLVEEAVIGKELECGGLGNEDARASVVGEIVATENFYSYDAKYISSTGATLQVPARIDNTLSDSIREYAVKAFHAIGCEGMARVDFLLSDNGKLVLNEINTLPGFTAISMYPKMWEQTGISEKELITELITLAVQRHERDTNLSVEVKP